MSATEARQGEIIPGKYGRWIWIGSFAAIVLLLVLGFCRRRRSERGRCG